LETYCVKCKEKREIQNPQAGSNSRSTPVTTGTCKVCGTKLYRMGRTEMHEGMVAPPRVKKEIKRKGKLVIVESPAKARTIGNFLGKGYTVRASVGHVRDLLRSQLSVDVENNFQPKYRIPNEKRAIVKELRVEAKKAEEVFLATDPDREGEAIAWHLMEAAELEPERVKRVVFHEITKTAIETAFLNTRTIDSDLVDAQQARRILDRLVGYNLTPLLWEKVRGRLSAGRVQSVALRLVVEREREIEAFNPQEYWSIGADFKPLDQPGFFSAKLAKVNGNDPILTKLEDVEKLLPKLKEAKYTIEAIKKGKRIRKPYAPFITSTLQQQASRQLGFTAKKTMRVAQQLYEGIDIGNGGQTGLITYMRTDSTNISSVALKEVRNYIKNTHGKEFLPDKVNVYKTKVTKAQEAHEAIRPTSIMSLPEKIKTALKPDQFKLYRLIWRRFVASQMRAATYTTVSIVVNSENAENDYKFRASGSELFFAGFLVLYEEAKDEDVNDKKNGKLKLPKGLVKGSAVLLVELLPAQHFTQAPPRFTEASLIQTLEEFGIGRPSTYAPTISTIQARGYVERENKRLIPTETGLLVNDLLIEYFPDILGVNFTAQMEEDLDEIANGRRKWNDLIADFYKDFEPKLIYAQKEMPEIKTEPEKIGRNCPKCGNELIIKWGRFGKFISCSNYPECKHTEPFLEKIGVACPKDGGDIVLRKTRKGRIFYGCENYPNCDFTSWKRPVKASCPVCGGILVTKNKNEFLCLGCDEVFASEKIIIKETA